MRRTLLLIPPVIIAAVGWLSATGAPTAALPSATAPQPGPEDPTPAHASAASVAADVGGQQAAGDEAVSAATRADLHTADALPPAPRSQDRTALLATRLPADAAGDQPDAAALAAEIGDPANSDLPAEAFAALSALGADVVVADTTGAGRDAFPGYWHGDRATPCCTTVSVHAAGAHLHPSRAGAVIVTVLWSAWDHDGDQLGDLSLVHLAEVDGAWRPQRPAAGP